MTGTLSPDRGGPNLGKTSGDRSNILRHGDVCTLLPALYQCILLLESYRYAACIEISYLRAVCAKNPMKPIPKRSMRNVCPWCLDTFWDA